MKECFSLHFKCVVVFVVVVVAAAAVVDVADDVTADVLLNLNSENRESITR